MVIKAKELLADKELVNNVERFFKNKAFYHELTSRVREIVDDGKLDFHDIPSVLLLISSVLNKSPQLQVNKKSMIPMVKMIIVRLLVEVKFLKDKENPLSEKQEAFIDSGLALLSAKMHFNDLFQYIKDTICGICCNKEDPDVEDALENHKKMRKIIKESETNDNEEDNKDDNGDIGDEKVDELTQVEPVGDNVGANAEPDVAAAAPAEENV